MTEHKSAAAGRQHQPTATGEPTLRQIMLRPKWLAALLTVLLIATGFAALAQWQLSHAIRLDQENFSSTETAVPLYELSPPTEPVRELAAGHKVTVLGKVDPASLQVLSDRRNETELGYWVVGRLLVTPPQSATVGDSSTEVSDVTSDSAAVSSATSEKATTGAAATAAANNVDSLTTAFGWAASETAAAAALQQLRESETRAPQTQLTGRYNPSEAPRPPKTGDTGLPLYTTLAPGQQLNLWRLQEPGATDNTSKTFPGYLVLEADSPQLGASGLTPIYSPPPAPVEKINWLNLFYAIEWVIFAGFALYFWVRLCRDAHEKEHELLQLQAAATITPVTPKEH